MTLSMFCYDRKVLNRILQLCINLLKGDNSYLRQTVVDEDRLDGEVAADPVGHVSCPVPPESMSIVLDPTALYSEPGVIKYSHQTSLCKSIIPALRSNLDYPESNRGLTLKLAQYCIMSSLQSYFIILNF